MEISGTRVRRDSVAARVDVAQVSAGHQFSQSQRPASKVKRKEQRPTMEAKETYYDWSSWQQESRVRREIKRPSIEERDNAPRARYDELAARPSRQSLKEETKT